MKGILGKICIFHLGKLAEMCELSQFARVECSIKNETAQFKWNRLMLNPLYFVLVHFLKSGSMRMSVSVPLYGFTTMFAASLFR